MKVSMMALMVGSLVSGSVLADTPGPESMVSTQNGGSNAQNSRSAGGLADSHVGGGHEGGGVHY